MPSAPDRLRAILAFPLAALPWLHWVTGGPSPTVTSWLVAAACGIGLWLVACMGPDAPAVGRSQLGLAAAVVAWAALSQQALWPEVLMLAGGLALVLLAAGAAGDRQVGRAMQAAFLAAAAASAVIGLCQYFGFAEHFTPWMSAARPGEAYANLRQPNQYAALCWIGGAILLFGTLALPRWAVAALVALLAVGAAASVSRTGMAQGLALAVLAAWWPGPQRRRRLWLCAMAVLAYLLASFALPLLLEAGLGAMPARTLWGRLRGGEGCSSRVVLWSNVLHLIAQRPLAGWGWGELDYAHYLTLYGGPRFCDILDNAHQLPLHLAVELGVPAALVICGLVVAWAWRRCPWREAEPLRQLAWAVLALLAVHSLLEYPLWYGPFQIALGLSIGWLAATAGPAARAPSRAGSAAVAAAAALALSYAAWDYLRVSQIYLQPEERRAAWREDTLQHARRSWLFQGPARFAEVTLAEVAASNAAWMHQEALRTLHYSPEPRVIERVIEAAVALGRDDEALLHIARYRAAFPRDYEAWRARQRRPQLR